MKHLDRNRLILLFIFLIVIILAFLIVRPFIETVFMSATLAFLFYPIYCWTVRKTNKPRLSATLLIILIILLIIIPSIFLVNLASREALIGYTVLKQKVGLLEVGCDQSENKLCTLVSTFGDISTTYYIQSALDNISSYVLTRASNFALSVPTLLVKFFVLIFTLFYFFTSGKNLVEGIKEFLPYSPREKDRIVGELYNMTYGIVYGTFVLAIIEAGIAWGAFALAGITGALIWSAMIFILAFIPMAGPTIVWVPAVLILVLTDNPVGALIIFTMGILISTIDTLLRPKIIGDRTKAHPVLILLGILGGMSFFGFIGVVLGPLILVLFFLLLRIFLDTKNGA